MLELQIQPIACLQDNYAYLITNGSADAWIVDPSEAPPILAELEKRSLTLRGILATHHHIDHVGGIQALVERVATDVFVAAHVSDRGRVPCQTHFVEAPQGRFVPSGIRLGAIELTAAHIPGHTLGAIAWCIPARDGRPADIFTGDTLFAGGCGRLFEGTSAQMFTSLQTLTTGNDDNRLWFGHEYTASNLRFAAVVEPTNAAIEQRRLALDPVTTPTTVGLEKQTNPFVRASSAEELGIRRVAKDDFR